jgi:tetratricopeptide (TPR) repeat protein
MKSDAIAFGIAGVFFGLIAGWIIGSQQPAVRQVAAPVAQTTANAPAGGGSTGRAAVLDEAQANALKSVADREPTNPAPRVQLATCTRCRAPTTQSSGRRRVQARTEGCQRQHGPRCPHYYVNQPDKALEQFDTSLKLDPKHAKTLLNLGIVKAFGKQDLQGASEAWQQVIKLSPDSPEAQAAKRALDSLQSAHPAMGTPQKPGA